MNFWRKGVGLEYMLFIARSLELLALPYALNRPPRAAASFNMVLDSCGLICFAHSRAKQANEINGSHRSGGIGPNHRAAGAIRGASPLGPIGQRTSLFKERQSGGGAVVLRGRISGTMAGAAGVGGGSLPPAGSGYLDWLER